MNLEQYAVGTSVIEQSQEEIELALSRWDGPVAQEMQKLLSPATPQGMVINLHDVIRDCLKRFSPPPLAVAAAGAYEVWYRPQPWREAEFWSWSTRRDPVDGNFERSVKVQGRKALWPVNAETPVPLVPTRLRPDDFDTCLVLFEVEKWERVIHLDPALLRPLGGELYEVVAMWDLTDLERRAIQRATQR